MKIELLMQLFIILLIVLMIMYRRRGGLPPRDNSYFRYAVWTGTTVYKGGTLVLISGRAFFCQSPVASTWPQAGLSRDHYIIPRLLIFQSATLFLQDFANKQCLTNRWGPGAFRVGLLFQNQSYHVLHGISKDIPCIYHTYTIHMDEDTICMQWYIPDIYQAYSTGKNRGSRCNS